MGHLCIAPTMHIQQGPHESPPGQNPFVPLPHKGISLLSRSSGCDQASISPTRLEAETFSVAATAAIFSASPLYKRPSLPNKPFTFFLTRSTLFKLTRCSPSFTSLNCFVFRCRALYSPSGVSPAFVPRQRLMLVMLADKRTRNVCSLSTCSDHAARGVPTQDSLARTPLWSMMMKPYPSANGHQDPNQADGNDSRQLALSPQVLIVQHPS
ncbi:hypothetical protein O181_111233 [Austropuccinia psidii MF-1]|uniref:Uncharacterized protein n=1 Tax=Austropuccinia psidii MF-1 TaxID=1389203 RepID=A0A9Q3PRI9_9BASI|nr:hypothetical protein [Austropuccinia psidii MF-1]